jgi:two-component system, OmpR family, phosphate regulon sensor histidine kinase PhoR
LKGLRLRLAIPVIVLITLLFGGLAIYYGNVIRNNEIVELEKKTIADALLLSDYLSSHSGSAQIPIDTIDQITHRWSQVLGARVTIVGLDGLVLGESHADKARMDNHLDRPEVQQSLVDGVGKSIRFSRTEGEEFIYIAVPFTNGKEPIGFARLSIPTSQVNAEISSLLQPLILATFIAIASSILMVGLFADYLARPIRKLNEEINRSTTENLNFESYPSDQDEIRQLASNFDTIFRKFRTQISILKKEQLRLESVLDRLTDGVIIVDEDGKIQLINPAAQKMFDVYRTNALGESLAKVTRHHQLVELWRETRVGNSYNSIVVELPKRNLLLQAIGSPLAEYLPGNTLLVFQDVTHVHHLEIIRRDFISNISHELRTPLASLKALTETLLDGALDDPFVSRHFLTQVDTEVDSLALMVQELLELSRIESGKVPLHLDMVSPEELISPAVDRLRLQAERSSLTLRVEIEPELPNVIADPIRMQQVIVNLIHNSIKFTPAGGEITISAKCEDKSIIFSVHDTGIGIAQHDLPRIFERFYKADRARSGGGTGLGLAISKHLVEVHRGNIWVESQEGIGSTFYFSLPQSSK